MMHEKYDDAMQFLKDYFAMDFNLFRKKYFLGKDIDRMITAQLHNKLFAGLSTAQMDIINDDKSQYIKVLAGPGSGKTKVLVHKLASLMLLEDVKPEQLLMLTFSRAAAMEFKERLLELVGDLAYGVEIRTFHSYCFNILGKIGILKESDDIEEEAVMAIMQDKVQEYLITKTALVIDEAQDMKKSESDLVKALMECNKEMRVIAVGDDDQNIYHFRGSDSHLMTELHSEMTGYELVENFRSDFKIVDFAN